jgi:hypothetical protein
MIYELRTYTVKPGTLGDMVKAASTVSLEIRGNNFGKLEGYWFTAISTNGRGCAPSSPRTRAGPASTFR